MGADMLPRSMEKIDKELHFGAVWRGCIDEVIAVMVQLNAGHHTVVSRQDGTVASGRQCAVPHGNQ